MRARAWIGFAAAVALQASSAGAEITPDTQEFPCPGPSEALWLATSPDRPDTRADPPSSDTPPFLARIDRRDIRAGGAFPAFTAASPAQRASRPSNDPRSPTYLPGFNR
ncbi:hypothetical protein BWI17_06090 [Betaproteobacteria bacterium GR16-43]|nr:hypothetical protein BWI17_06090 [Betaproteobacteria bacterium GR16-43]